MAGKVNHALLGEFFDEIDAVNLLTERFKIYERYIHTLGFEGATYTDIPRFPMDMSFQYSPVFVFTDSFPQSFLTQYKEDQFERHDFTIRRVSSYCTDILDWRENELRKQVSLAEAKVIRIARADHRIRNALTIPTMTGIAGIAGASIVSSDTDAHFQLLKAERLRTLLLMTKSFHFFVLSDQSWGAQFMQSLLDELSEKEIKILHHMAKGEAFKRVEYSVDVASSKVAANILDKLRGKLGGVTRDRLMFLVGLYNLFGNDPHQHQQHRKKRDENH